MKTQYRITLINEGKPTVSFYSGDSLSIFRSAMRAGIEMTAGCMQGRCQICRAQLLSGEVKSLRPLSKYATVDPACLPNNMVLPCSIVPCSDVSLSPRGPFKLGDKADTYTVINRETLPVWD